MPNSTALHMITVFCFGYITLALASVLTNCKINMLRPRFPRSPLSWSCFPVRTLIAVCYVVSTLLCCLKRRRRRIEIQSLCLANGAIATGTILVATRYFQESSNRIFVILFLSQGFGLSIRLHHIFTKVLQNLAARVGIEPTTN